MVFAEPDRTSLKLAAERIATLTGAPVALPPGSEDNDALFAEAIGKADAVLGYYFDMLPDASGAGAAPVSDAPGDERRPCPEFCLPVAAVETLVRRSELPLAAKAVLNLPCLNDAALSEGFFNNLPDVDGVTRRGSLLVRYGDMLYPSLALEMVREGLGTEPRLVSNTPGVGVTGLVLGDRTVPITLRGQVCINFRGPPKTFRYVSAVDVLRGRAPAGALAGRQVLVGTSAIGLLDLRATPFAPDFPGVEVNASIIDNILAGDPMVYDKGLDLGLSVALVVLFGAMLAAGLAYLGPRTGALCGALFLLLVAYGNYRLFFLHGRLVGVTYVVVSLVAVFMVVERSETTSSRGAGSASCKGPSAAMSPRTS